VLPSVVAATTTIQNFSLHEFQSYTWRVHLMTTHTRVQSMSLCESLHRLACSLHSCICMLMSKSSLQPCSGYAQNLFFVCACCVRYESICRTHKQSHIRYCTNVISIMNEKSWVSRLSLTPSVSHVEHVCLDGLGHVIFNLCECVFVWSPMHLLVVHTLSHFAKVLTNKLHSKTQTITPLSTRLNVK